MYEEAYRLNHSPDGSNNDEKYLSDARYAVWKGRRDHDFERWPRYSKWWNEEMCLGMKDAWDIDFVEEINANNFVKSDCKKIKCDKLRQAHHLKKHGQFYCKE